MSYEAFWSLRSSSVARLKSFTTPVYAHFEAKNFSSGPAYLLLINGISTGKVVRPSVFPRIDAKNIDREVQPKRSSFSGKKEVAKPFLYSKLSNKSC